MRSVAATRRLCGLGLLLLLGSAPALAMEAAPSSPDPTLAARLSDAPEAMEYWDVTAWLESGDRVFARFLVTNQGPGTETAAAVGHVVLASGEVVPFKWGRRRGAWTLGPERRSLAIASATLELGARAVVVTVDSTQRGIDVRLEIARDTPLVAATPGSADYGFDVAMPATAHGHIRTRGMAAARAVVGTGAVTHTWMQRPEGEVLRRRVELLARENDVALYLCELTLADGSHRSTAVASRAARVLARADDGALTFGDATAAGGDPRYPLASEWEAASPALAARVAVGREVLRMDPLDILPQPFRMLVALGGRPERLWAEATFDLRLPASGAEGAARSKGSGIVSATFAGPSDGP